MKNFIRTLLLVTIGCMILSPIAMAQDALSAYLPAPWTNRVGTQLIYFYEDGANLGARGSFQSYLTITNTSITSSVRVHYQFYQVVVSSGSSTTCQELFDWSSTLTAGHRWIIDPKSVKRGPGSSAQVGVATDGRYILTATPVQSPSDNDYRVSAFNWLSGQIWVSDTKATATWMTNAVARMAVDRFGNPLPNRTLVTGPYNVLDGYGNDNYLQLITPYRMYVNSFFKTAGTGAVAPGVPFGNRMTVMTWADIYYSITNNVIEPFYRIAAASAQLTGHVFDDSENPYSLPPRIVTCLQEWVVAPDVANATGNWPDYLGPALTSAVASTGGWIRLTVTYLTGGLQNILGWFSQYLGPYAGGDYMIGSGRVAPGGYGVSITPNLPLLITNTNSAGAQTTRIGQVDP